jgi:hypothetical protein
MAGDTKINVVERHVEKGVLLICVLLLVVFAMENLASSPREIGDIASPSDSKIQGFYRLPKAVFPPQEVDAALKAAAAAALENAENSEEVVSKVRNYTAELEAVRQSPWPMGLMDNCVAMSFPPPPERVHDGPEVTTIPLDVLQGALDRVPLTAPGVMIDRQVTRRQVDGGDQAVTQTVAHLWATYPFEELFGSWEEELSKAATPIRVVVTKVEVQRREQSAAGEWGDPKMVQTIRSGSADQPPELPVFTVDPNNAAEVVAAVQSLLQEQWQGPLLRPSYWPILDGAGGESPWPAYLVSLAPDVDVAQVLWAHDESVRAKRSYSYRYRIWLVNPLLASPLDVAKGAEDEATVAAITTPWSDWSEPVLEEASTEFFASSVSMRGVRVTILVEAVGQTVKESFWADAGMPVAGVKIVRLFNPISKKEEPIEVSFDTGAVLVSLDGEVDLLRGVTSQPTNQVIYLNAEGELRSRLVAIDRDEAKNR